MKVNGKRQKIKKRNVNGHNRNVGHKDGQRTADRGQVLMDVWWATLTLLLLNFVPRTN